MSVSHVYPIDNSRFAPFAGEYIPTIANQSNITSITSPIVRYMRVNNIVECMFYARIVSQAATPIAFSISLPIDPGVNFTSNSDCPGLIVWVSDANPVNCGTTSIQGAPSKLLRIQVNNTGVNNGDLTACFAYKIS